MTRGNKLKCPRIVVVQAAEPRFATVEEAWAAVGPVIARLVAAAILKDDGEQRGPTTRYRLVGHISHLVDD
jgi:hypothetical protein